MIRTLGVDIGIASIGWALIEEDAEGLKIIESGVRIFPKAENPKDKSSLALPRREARSARRRTRRKRERILQIKKYLSNALQIPLKDMIQENKLAPLFQTSKDFSSPWELRVRALERKLTDLELARVILHIAKYRGYDDVTYGLEDSEGGKIKKAIAENQKVFQEKGYRTIGEMMTKEFFQQPRPNSYPLQWDNVRNHPSSGDYKRCIGRSELIAELQTIFEIQKELGNFKITQEFERVLLGDSNASGKKNKEGMIFNQRPLKSFENKIGKCQFFKDEPRACKNAPSAEEFVALTRISNFLMYLKNEFGDLSCNLAEAIPNLLQEAQKTKKGLSYAKLKALLALPEKFSFRELDYSNPKAESQSFVTLENSYVLGKLGLEKQTQDQIAEILGANKDWEVIEKRFKTLNLSAEQIQKLKESKLSFSKHINLSLKALGYLLPLMREGRRYDEAVESLQSQGIFPKVEMIVQDVLPPLVELAKQDSYFEISNPVVYRALSEFRKVVNALLEKHGKFHYFNIELTREVGKSAKQRSQIEKYQKDNQTFNAQALNVLRSYGLKENAKNLLKCKLWLEQDGKCIYSHKTITGEHLRDDRALQIDHILPISRSLDDSQSNKVLCLTDANQGKLNKTPYEFFNEKEWEDFKARILASKLPRAKKQKLLNQNFKDRSPDSFLQRNLIDTGYIGNVVKSYVKSSLKFLPLPDRKVEHLRVISGSLTSALRSYWGISSKNREHRLHHAQDAIIVACVNPAMVAKYSNFLKRKELFKGRSEEKAQALSEADYRDRVAFERTTKDFRAKVQESIETIIVSHSVSRKVTGALHQETIRKKEEYYGSFGGEEGVKKALKFGKIRQINGGIVDNGEMIRVDVFKSKDKGKFYAVPVYTFDFALGKLPNKAIVSGKKDGVLKDWIEMDENYEFCFSLFKNDCVNIQTKEMQEPVFALYKGTSSSTASMDFEHLSKFVFANENEEKFFSDTEKGSDKKLFSRKGCGIQGLKVFQKCNLGVLGEIKICKPSKRQAISLKSSPKDV